MSGPSVFTHPDAAKTKKFILLTVILCFPLIGVIPSQDFPQGAWLRDGSKWESAPRDINPQLQSAEAAILYFGKDHKFALIYCTVGRAPKQYMVISNGDPRNVYEGEWKTEDKSISVTYRLVEATILRSDQKLPGPIRHGIIELSNGTVVIFKKETYRRVAALDRSAAEAVHEPKGQQVGH